MKKLSCLFVAVLLLFCSFDSVFATEIDLDALSFDELAKIKQKVDFEYNSREEAEPFKLLAGVYSVGTDIAPGSYYVACVDVGANVHTWYYIFDDMDKYKSYRTKYEETYSSRGYLNVGDEPVHFTLKEGNVIYIDGKSPATFCLHPFSSFDYIQYELPDGTFVPVGIYEVGDNRDIPPGKYNVYSGNYRMGIIKVYDTYENFGTDGLFHLNYDRKVEVTTSDKYPESIILNEGNVVLVEEDVVMKRQGSTKLNFD